MNRIKKETLLDIADYMIMFSIMFSIVMPFVYILNQPCNVCYASLAGVHLLMIVLIVGGLIGLSGLILGIIVSIKYKKKCISCGQHFAYTYGPIFDKGVCEDCFNKAFRQDLEEEE